MSNFFGGKTRLTEIICPLDNTKKWKTIFFNHRKHARSKFVSTHCTFCCLVWRARKILGNKGEKKSWLDVKIGNQGCYSQLEIKS